MPAAAQTADVGDEWQFTMAPYLLFPHMNGSSTVGGFTADVDASPGDVFDKLHLGAMLYLEMANQAWRLALDVIYMDLRQTGMTPVTEREAQVDLKQAAFDLAGFRRVAPWAEFGLGARLNVLDMGLVIDPGEVLPGAEVGANKTWLDPLIGTILTVPLEGRWRVGMRGDIGGFGIGSKFAWQVHPKVGYQFSSLFELGLAYRAMGMDYETGSGETLFVYDMVIFGPEVVLTFHF